MLDFFIFIVRKNRRTFHALFAVTLFISYYSLEDKPDDDDLPEFEIVVIKKDDNILYV